MKILFVAGVLFVLALTLYRLLRPYIRMARQFLKSVRHFQSMVNPVREKSAAEKLVKCETCGIWIPESRTLASGSLAYCSRDCLKRAGMAQRKNTAA